MKRRLLALLMSLVMILSVLPGAAFAEPADSSDVLTYADLADIDSSITIPDGASASEELSVADAVRALLLWTGMSEKQLGKIRIGQHVAAVCRQDPHRSARRC